MLYILGIIYKSLNDILCVLRVLDVKQDLVSVIDVDVVDKDVMNAFYRLKSKSGDKSDITDSLDTIMCILYTVYGKKVILLIDEYDVPLAKASEGNTAENGYYDKMLKIMQGIMETALKDNKFLKFAVVTGCLRISKESIFTGTNNFVSYSILDKRFSSFLDFLKMK